ncbi:MAG: hypothetical protein KKA79_04790 [Nanoarchaeota archaeon]|nr:hypothetical protein [Nanoarchaeota archaeon]
MDMYTLEILFTGMTGIATAIMAVTILQLWLTLKQLKFQALEKTYDYLENEIKEDLNCIYKWAEKGSEPEYVLGKEEKETDEIKENRKKLRNVSIALNKTGYLVYKKILDIKSIQEEFVGLVMTSSQP